MCLTIPITSFSVSNTLICMIVHHVEMGSVLTANNRGAVVSTATNVTAVIVVGMI